MFKMERSNNEDNCFFTFSIIMNALNFCGGSNSGNGVYPLHSVNSVFYDLHHQMAEQYQVYSSGNPSSMHTLSVAERLAGNEQ